MFLVIVSFLKHLETLVIYRVLTFTQVEKITLFLQTHILTDPKQYKNYPTYRFHSSQQMHSIK